jgi:hypothetical protein
MKRILLGLSLLVALSNSLIAQTYIDNSVLINNNLGDIHFKRITEDNNFRFNPRVYDVLGTPYLDKEFKPGEITAKDGAIVSDLHLRYNACNDELEFQKGEDQFVVDPKEMVNRAEFGGKVFVYWKYDADGKSQGGFFELLTEGKATLLIKYTVKFFQKEVAKPFEDPKPARFDAPVKEYYLAFGVTPAKLVINKKKFLEFFGDQKSEMEEFISKNKLSIKDDESMKKIIAHYNTL